MRRFARSNNWRGGARDRATKVTDLIAWANFAGNSVEIGYIEYGFGEKTPAAYRRLLEGYVEQVAAYGITVGNQQPCPAPTPTPVNSAQSAVPLPWSFGEPVQSPEPESRSTIRYENKLMTKKKQSCCRSTRC